METKSNGFLEGLKNLGTGVVWSTRSFSLAADGMLLAFLTFYCSNSLGLDLGIVGTLLLVAKVCDAISNFVVAYIVDNTHFKLGKGRPFEICIIPMWLCTFALFGIPIGWNTVVQYAVVFLMYVLIMSIFQTALYCTEAIYFNYAVKDEKRRISVQTVNGFVNVITYSLIGIVLPQLMGRYLGQENGWLKIALTIGVPCMIIGMIRFVCFKEVNAAIAANGQDKITIRDTVKGLTSSKYVLFLMAIYFIVNMVGGFGSATTYYFTDIVGDVGKMSVVNAFGVVGMLAIPLCPLLSRKFTKSQLISYFMAVGAMGCMIRLFAGSNLVLLTLGSILGGVVTYPIAVFGNLMLIDCMDYGEWKNGKRVEGAIFAASSLGSTIGSGVGNAVFGYIMNFFGYDGMAAVQTESAIFGIKLTFAILPAVFYFGAAIIMHFYSLDKQMPQIKADLEQRHAQAV